MKYLILPLAAAVAMLSGCASQLQAVKGFNAAAVVSLRAAEDINLERQVFEICATPFSAIARNPNIVPGIMGLCLPNGNASNPANVLNAVAPAKP